jgi:hypothetical protein
MTTSAKKALLKKLIESEKDGAVLDLVDNVLQRRTRGVAYQSDLVKRVLQSEEDYKAGRVKTLDEFSSGMKGFIDSLYVAPKKPVRRK